MPKQRSVKGDKDLRIDFGTVSDKQMEFLMSETFFTCYGGARGGGKTHVARLKAVGLCVNYPGIQVLMVRAHYPELTANLIDPILKWVPNELYSYNGTDHKMTFWNGSVIKFGHYDGKAAENEYQGTQYDVIFLEEATQLSERAFLYLQTCCRGTGEFPRRMYLTCNPGGVGHKWVKRLFIDKDYRRDPTNPERDENPADYTFIFATVDDNKWLLEGSPMYLKNLASLPKDLMKAHRYGDWNALSGAYFSNFNEHTHLMPRFQIPDRWPTYRSIDYGLDALAIGWFAVDEDGRAWVYRYYQKPDLVIQQAARAIVENTPVYERPVATYAPQDMWNRQKETGKAMADIFATNGAALVKSDNNRVQGHMILRDMMSPMPLNDPYVISLFPEGTAPSTLPGLMLFDDMRYIDPDTNKLVDIVEDISSIQADEKNPNDCSKDPHDVTHSVDMLRYFAIMRSRKATEVQKKKKIDPFAFLSVEDAGETAYQEYMCGGEINDNYMS